MSMKKIILLLAAVSCTLSVLAQGTLQVTEGANLTIGNGAYLVLNNMHLVNNGTLEQTGTDGTLKFTGAADVNISGSGTTTFGHLLLAKGSSAKLTLQTNLSVASKIDFSGGLLNLDNAALNLGSTGILTEESETSHAYTTGTGYIQATGNLNSPAAVNLGNLGAVITSSADLGNSTIRRGHAAQNNVAGTNSSIRRYYDIVPQYNNNLNATLHFQYLEAELNSIPESSLSQWQSEDRTNWTSAGFTTRNTANNYVEKTGIANFSRWTLAGDDPPGIICPANITVGNTSGQCGALVPFSATVTGNPAPTVTYKVGQTVISSPYTFPVGTTVVTATASNGGQEVSCSFKITVTDNQLPFISPVIYSPTVLAPPNHKMRDIVLNYTVADNCPGVTYAVAVTSNEPISGIWVVYVGVLALLPEVMATILPAPVIVVGSAVSAAPGWLS